LPKSSLLATERPQAQWFAAAIEPEVVTPRVGHEVGELPALEHRLQKLPVLPAFVRLVYLGAFAGADKHENACHSNSPLLLRLALRQQRA
jgi:hypothetical protein